jgi:ribosomal protein S27AE
MLLLKLPLYALYAVLRLLLGLGRLPGRISQTRRLLETELPCPCCSTMNALTGRWVCGTCGGTYLGFVGLCTICGASCRYFPCSACRGSIVVKR